MLTQLNLLKLLLYFVYFFLYLCHLNNNNKSESNTKFLDLDSIPSVENELISYTQ